MKYSIQHAVVCVCVCSVTHIIQYNSILECNFRPVSIEYRNSAHILSFPPITCTLIVCRTDGKRMQCRRFLLYARYISEENFIICIYIYSIIFIWLAGLTKNQFAIASFIRNQIGADHLLWLFCTSSNTHTYTQTHNFMQMHPQRILTHMQHTCLLRYSNARTSDSIIITCIMYIFKNTL